jgi:hypothetical protein
MMLGISYSASNAKNSFPSPAGSVGARIPSDLERELGFAVDRDTSNAQLATAHRGLTANESGFAPLAWAASRVQKTKNSWRRGRLVMRFLCTPPLFASEALVVYGDKVSPRANSVQRYSRLASSRFRRQEPSPEPAALVATAVLRVPDYACQPRGPEI